MNEILPLLVHKKFISYEWGRSIVGYFYKYAKKYDLDIKLIYNYQDILSYTNCGFVIVLGVDLVWLGNVIKQISSTEINIIIMNGNINIPYSKISKINFNQKMIIKNSIEILQQKSRTHTALFGVQENDTSDASKADEFASLVSQNDIYYTNTCHNIADCFSNFFKNIEKYDSVICANDIIAIYLLSRLSELNITVPDKLHVIGNGNLRIGSYVSPTFTTASYNMGAMVEATVYILKSMIHFSAITNIDISLSSDIIERGSTGVDYNSPNSSFRYPYQLNNILGINEDCKIDEELMIIKNIDRVLTMSSEVEISILSKLLAGSSYDNIAKDEIMSPDTIKYHIKKLYKNLNIHRHTELIELFDKYKINIK